MEKIVNAILKYVAFVITGMSVGIITLFYCVSDWLYSQTEQILGTPLYTIVFLLLPFLAFFIPLLLKIFKKINWRTAFLCALLGTVLTAGVSAEVRMLVEQKLHVFSIEYWREYPRERAKMLDNLTQKYQLVGMEVEAVKQLLGPPFTENEFDMIYFLDQGRHGDIWFVLEFSEQMIIKSYTFADKTPSGLLQIQ